MGKELTLSEAKEKYRVRKIKFGRFFSEYKLLQEGIYVIGFFFPVVAKGQARIRVQLSAAHTKDHLDKALAAFEKVGKELGVIK